MPVGHHQRTVRETVAVVVHITTVEQKQRLSGVTDEIVPTLRVVRRILPYVVFRAQGGISPRFLLL